MISIMLLKFESTAKIDLIRWRHYFKDNQVWNCQYLGNEIKYEAEISHIEVAYDACFIYCMDLFTMSSCIATRWLVHNGGYIQKSL